MPSRVPLREQCLAFRELATMVGAGVTMVQALDNLQSRTRHHDFRRFLRTAGVQVGKGQRLSALMRAQGEMFPEIVMALIEAGEQSGRLEDTLRDVAAYLERELELRYMISRETFYAKILIGAVLFIPLVARTAVAWLTEGGLAAAGVFLKGLGLYALLGALPLLIIWFVYTQFHRSETGKRTVDGAKLLVPVIGPIVERLALARFARGMATLYAAGVNLPDAIELSADISANRAIAGTMKSAIPHVKQGRPFSEPLLRTRLASSLLVRLLQTGEQTGQTDDMMTKAAEHYEDEAHTHIRRLAVTIVPVVIIIMGIVVCVMVARFYLGYYAELLR